MARPHKGTRRIVCHGRPFRWKATYEHYYNDYRCIPYHLVVGLESAATTQTLRAVFYDGRGTGAWTIREEGVTPRIVRRIIDAALAAGWRPEEPGLPTFVMDGYPFLDSIPEG
jgi:hypothetical protein